MWPCPNCNEQIEDQFDLCWKCGANKAGKRTSDEFQQLGSFDALEADRLLKQFLAAGIRFRIDRIEHRERSGNTSYRTVGLIEIFAHPDDYEKAHKIVTAEWKV